jgi:hypothetical protein
MEGKAACEENCKLLRPLGESPFPRGESRWSCLSRPAVCPSRQPGSKALKNPRTLPAPSVIFNDAQTDPQWSGSPLVEWGAVDPRFSAGPSGDQD